MLVGRIEATFKRGASFFLRTEQLMLRLMEVAMTNILAVETSRDRQWSHRIVFQGSPCSQIFRLKMAR